MQCCGGLRQFKIFATFVAVPKATVDKDAGSIFPQHQVGMTGEPRVVETIAEATRPEIVADNYLRMCTLGSNRGHITMYLLSGFTHSYLKRT